MKRIFLLLSFIVALQSFAFAQVPLKIREVDGTPKKTMPSELVFPNGTLTVSGGRVTYAPAGGSSLTVGASAISSGTCAPLLRESLQAYLIPTAMRSF
jgi:hypothetical protein